MSTTAAAPDFAAVKQRQQATWAAGDYAVVGTTLQIVGERLCEAIDLRAGERVLDVAAGNGHATLAAARRFAEVTSTDYVGALLDRGRERAAAERLAVSFQEADAETCPSPMGASTPRSRPSASCSRRTRRRRPPNWSASSAGAAASASPTGRRTASSASSLLSRPGRT